MKTRVLNILLLVCLLAVCLPLMAQTAATGSLQGTVTDASGAVIPNATVTLTSAGTGQERTATTGGDGTYRFPLIQPGAYKLKFAANGFKGAEATGINVNVTESPVFDQKLEVGTAAEQVTVEANVETLQTASSSMGTVVGSATATSIPLTTRNYTNLLGLSAGANASVNNASALGRGGMEIAVNGASTAQNTFQMDGVSVVNYASSGLATEDSTYPTIGIPNPDTIAEFKIQTSLYDAGYGRNPGANVNVVTKSGTNALHGTAFEFFRNTDLNANDFFRNRSGGSKQVLNQNQFGGIARRADQEGQAVLLRLLSADLAEERHRVAGLFDRYHAASDSQRRSLQHGCVYASPGRGFLPRQSSRQLQLSHQSWRRRSRHRHAGGLRRIQHQSHRGQVPPGQER